MVICLGVVGATYAVLKFAVEPEETATTEHDPGRGAVAVAAEAPAEEALAAAVAARGAPSTVVPGTAPPPAPLAPERSGPRHLKPGPVDPEQDADGPIDVATLAAHGERPKELFPPMGPPEAVQLPRAQRLRSGVLLVALLTALGAFAALVIGLAVVGLVTGIRAAIG